MFTSLVRNRLFTRRFSITAATLAIAIVNIPQISHAQCANLALCTSHDINLPVNIVNTTTAPAFTVLGGRVGLGTTSPQAGLDLQFTGSDSALLVPRDTTANRPSGVAGMIRYNTDTQQFEGFSANSWQSLASGSSSGGNTGNTTSPWAQNGTTLSYTSGLVGVGTNNPQGPLHVLNPNSDGSLIVEGGNTTGANATLSLWSRGSNGAINYTWLGADWGGQMMFQSTNGGYYFKNANGAPAFSINNEGNVAVGSVWPTEKLHVVGNLRVDSTVNCIIGNGSGGTNCSSDERLKDNVRPIQNALEKINRLRGVEFTWNTWSSAQGKESIGVIAQEVQKVFPTSVIEDASAAHYKMVDYASLVAPLIEATKEMHAIIQAQEKRIQELERKDLERQAKGQ